VFIKAIAVEPDESPVLSRERSGLHKIQWNPVNWPDADRRARRAVAL